MNEFIRALRERLIDCRWQNWEDHVQTSDRLSMYIHFNSISHCTKTYIYNYPSSLYIIIGIEIVSKCFLYTFLQ